MGFPVQVAVGRFKAQNGRCALCGDRVSVKSRRKGQPGAWHAHHIDGQKLNNRYDNCAVVCTDCHLDAHMGMFAGHHLRPRSAFHLYGWTAAELAARIRRNPAVAEVRLVG
jgi:5-methylcytosine-specific restriction endonuclease McrA